MQRLSDRTHDPILLLVSVGPIKPWIPMPTRALYKVPCHVVLVDKMAAICLLLSKEPRRRRLQSPKTRRSHLPQLLLHGCVEAIKLYTADPQVRRALAHVGKALVAHLHEHCH